MEGRDSSPLSWDDVKSKWFYNDLPCYNFLFAHQYFDHNSIEYTTYPTFAVNRKDSNRASVTLQKVKG